MEAPEHFIITGHARKRYIQRVLGWNAGAVFRSLADQETELKLRVVTREEIYEWVKQNPERCVFDKTELQQTARLLTIKEAEDGKESQGI